MKETEPKRYEDLTEEEREELHRLIMADLKAWEDTWRRLRHVDVKMLAEPFTI